jgi:hypothetical protein
MWLVITGSAPEWPMWDLWWTKCHEGRFFFLKTLIFPFQLPFHQCPVLIRNWYGRPFEAVVPRDSIVIRCKNSFVCWLLLHKPACYHLCIASVLVIPASWVSQNLMRAVSILFFVPHSETTSQSCYWHCSVTNATIQFKELNVPKLFLILL